MLDRRDRRALARWQTLLVFLALGSGCSSGDTVVALNVEFKMPLDGLNNLEVTIEQAGQSPNVSSITPPTDPSDAGPKIRSKFYERITLPDGWKEEPATIKVVAKSTSGATLESETTMADIVEHGAVAAFVTFGAPPPPPDAGPGDDAGIK